MASCIANRAASFLSPSAVRTPSLQSTTCSSVQLLTPSPFYCRAVYLSRSNAVLNTFPVHLEKPWLTSSASVLTSSNALPAASLFLGTIPGSRSICHSPVLQCSASGGIKDEVVKKNQENAVIVYSKSWCPYCAQVKGLFKQLGVPHKIIELDELNEEREVQDALYELTRQTTVPNVFIGGKHIGGCDDTLALRRNGQLFKLLSDVGIDVPSS